MKSTSRRGKRSGRASAIADDTEPLVIDTIDDARELCATWQKILRLQDWEVKVNWELPHVMEAVGRVRQNFNHKLAIIQMAPQAALTEEDHDLHETLVHELLHLFLTPIVKYEGEAQENAVEVACNHLSDALVALAREAFRGRED